MPLFMLVPCTREASRPFIKNNKKASQDKSLETSPGKLQIRKSLYFGMFHVVCGIRGKSTVKKKKTRFAIKKNWENLFFNFVFFYLLFLWQWMISTMLMHHASCVQSNGFFPIIIKGLPDHFICCKVCALLISSNRYLFELNIYYTLF